MRKLLTLLGWAIALLSLAILNHAQAQPSQFVVPAYAYQATSFVGQFTDISTDPNTVMLGMDLTSDVELKQYFYKATSESVMTCKSEKITTVAATNPTTYPCFPLGFTFYLSGTKPVNYFIVSALGGVAFSETPSRPVYNPLNPTSGVSSTNVFNAAPYCQATPGSTSAPAVAPAGMVKRIGNTTPAMYLISGTEGNHVLTVQYDYAVNGDEWIFQYKFYEATGTIDFIVKEFKTANLISTNTKSYYAMSLGYVESPLQGYATATAVLESTDKVIDILGQNYLYIPALVNTSQHKYFTGSDTDWGTLKANPGTTVSTGQIPIKLGAEPEEGRTIRLALPACDAPIAPLPESAYNLSNVNEKLSKLSSTNSTFSAIIKYATTDYYEAVDNGTIVAVLSNSPEPDYTLADGTVYSKDDKFPASNGFTPTVLCNRYPRSTVNGTAKTVAWQDGNGTSTQVNYPITLTVDGITEGVTRYIHLHRMVYNCAGAPKYSPVCHTIVLTLPIDKPQKLELAGLPTVNSVQVKAKSADGDKVIVIKSSSLTTKPSGVLKVGDKIGDNAEVVALFEGEQTFTANLKADEQCYFLAFTARTSNPDNYTYSLDKLWVSTRAAYNGLPGFIDMGQVGGAVKANQNDDYNAIPFGWTRALDVEATGRQFSFELSKAGRDRYNKMALWATTSEINSAYNHDIITPPIKIDKKNILLTYHVQWYKASDDGTVKASMTSGDSYEIQYDFGDNNWISLKTFTTQPTDENKYGCYPFETSLELDDSKIGQYIRFRYVYKPKQVTKSVYHAIHYMDIKERKSCLTPESIRQVVSQTTTTQIGLQWVDGNPTDKAASYYIVAYKRAGAEGDWNETTVTNPNVYDKPTTKLTGLRNTTSYLVQIKAVCGTEESYITDTATLSTAWTFPYDEPMAQLDTLLMIQGSRAQVPYYSPFPGKPMVPSIALSDGGVSTATGSLPTTGNASLTYSTGDGSDKSVFSHAQTINFRNNVKKADAFRKDLNAVGVCEAATQAWLITPVIYTVNLTADEPLVVRFKARSASKTGTAGTYTVGSVGSAYNTTTLKVLVSNTGDFANANVIGTVNVGSETINGNEYEFELSTQVTGTVQVAFYYNNPKGTTDENNTNFMLFEIYDVRYEYKNEVAVCLPLEGLERTFLTPTGATFEWAPSEYAAYYEVTYGPKDGEESEYITSEHLTEPTYTITGLNEQTTYTIKVTGYCDEEGENAAPDPLEAEFTTPEGCHTPTTFRVKDIEPYGATFTSAQTQSILIEREVKIVSSDNSFSKVFKQTGEELVLTDDLLDNMSYTAQTRSICAYGTASRDTSAWSTSIAFATPVDPTTLPDTFNITLLVQPENAGTVTGAGQYLEDEEIEMVATASAGYRFVEWQNASGNSVGKNAVRKVIAKAGNNPDVKTHDSTFTAVFKAIYEVTVTASPTAGGTVTGAGIYDEGTEVTVTATPKTNYVFTGWQKNGTQVSTNPTYKFTPDADAALTALFRLKEYYALNVTEWDATDAANLTQNDELGTVTASVQPNEDETYVEGTSVTLTATPAQYCKFVSWQKPDGTQLSTNTTYTVTMNENKDIRAVFAHNRYKVTLVASPSTDYGVILGTDGNQSTGGTFNAGTERRLTAQPKSGYAFVKWMNGTVQLGTDPVYVFTLTENITITAVFEEKSMLDINVTIEPANAGTVAGAGKAVVARNAQAELTATPAAHYAFKEWRRTDNSTITGNPYKFTATRDYNFTAVFRALENYTLTVQTQGNGTVTGQKDVYEENEKVELTATPAENYVFTEWKDLEGTTLGTGDTYVIEKIKANTTVVAVFTELPKYQVTVTRVPGSTAGTVEGAGTYHKGKEVTLTAKPATGYKFVEWRKASDDTKVSDQNPYIFTPTANVSLKAVFEALCEIKVTVNPTGAGTVTGAGTYNQGDEVSLSATVDDDYVFVAWQDANGDALSTANPYKFTATVSKTVTAKFREKDYYSIEVPCVGYANNDEENLGSVGIPGDDNGKYQEGKTVTMTATPNQYCRFVEWRDNKGNKLGTNPTYTFVISRDTLFQAVFTHIKYTVTLVSNPSTDWGTIRGTSGNITDGGTFNAGTTRSLKAEPRPGYVFEKWMSGSTELGTDPSYEFTLTQDITITAYFKEKDPLVITVNVDPADAGTVTGAGEVKRGNSATLTATPAAHYAFKEWKRVDGNVQSTVNPYTFTPLRDYTLTAVFRNLDNYTVTVTHNTGGTVTKDGTEVTAVTCEEGSTVTLTAEPQEGYAFRNWTVNGNAVLDAEATHTFTPTGNVTINAVFTKLDQFHVALYRYYNGGLWVDAGKLLVNDEDTREGDFYDGETITIKANPNKGYHFVEWRTYDGFAFVSSDNPYEFAVTSETEYWAVFDANVKIDVAIAPKDENPGTVKINGEQKTTGLFDKDDEVTLEATANNAYLFVAWQDADGNTLSTANPYKFTATASKNITAKFRAKEYFTLDVTWDDQLGNVTFSPVSTEGEYQEGTQVTMTAAPAQYCTFAGWQDMAGNTVSTNLTHTVTMDGDKAGRAVFERIQYTVTLKSNPASYGSIKGTLGSTTTGGTFNAGTKRTLTAQPNPGYEFVKWMNGDQELGTDPVYEFILTQDITITAYFKEKEELTVSVNIEPTDAGTVTGAGKVQRGNSATLTATPAAHYAFKEWRRTDNSTITENPYTIASVTRDHTLTAVFRDLENYTLTVQTEGSGTVTGNKAVYEEGEKVTMTAAPAEHYVFTEWKAVDGTTLGTNETYIFDISENTTVVAVFTEMEKYNVTVTRVPGAAAGTVTGAGTSYYVGTEVTLTATAAKGYKFVEWQKTDGTKVSEDNPYKFTIGAAVSLRAVFEALCEITVTVDPEGAGEVTGAGTYDINDAVTLETTVNDNYVFVAWQDADGNALSTANPYTFTATANRTVTAKFREKEYFTLDVPILGYTDNDEDNLGSVSVVPTGVDGAYKEGASVTMTATPKPYCRFVEWRDNKGNKLGENPTLTFVIAQDTLFQAVFTHIRYTVTLKSDPNTDYGIINGTTGNPSTGGTFNAGTTRKLEAKPRSGYEFVKWMSGTTELGTDVKLEFVLTRDTTITAYFKEKPELTITVNVNPTEAGTVTGAGKVQRGNDAVLTATANAGYKFLYWERIDGTQYEDNPYTLVKPQRDYTFKAQFRAKEQYTITTVSWLEGKQNSAAGTITREGFLANGKAEEDATITLTANPAEGYQFEAWQDATGKQVGTDATFSFTATANATYRAVFAAIPVTEFTVTLLKDPEEGGTVRGDGLYRLDDNVSITATPGRLYMFDGWYDGTTKLTAERTYTFTITGDVTYTAKFIKRATVDVDVTVRLGETPDPTVGTVTGAGEYAIGENVTLTATPSSDEYIFSGWRDINDDDKLISSANPLTFMVFENLHYAAVFREKFEVKLNIDPDEHAGTVTGAGAYKETATVTITAKANEGYVFVAWLDEDGQEVSIERTYSFTMTGNVTYTAKFVTVDEEHRHTIKVNRLPNNEAGTATGAGRYLHGAQDTLRATAATNYLFVAWLRPNAEDDTQYDTVSKKNPYIFTVDEDVTYTALFRQRARYNIEVDVLPNDNAGIVTGDGEVREGRTVTLEATPNPGYTFVAWVNPALTAPRDTVSRTSTYAFTATRNATYKAIFRRTTAKYTLTLNASPAAGGTVEGQGVVDGQGVFIANSTVTITATPNEGYLFVGWRTGGRIVSKELTYQFKIEEDVTYTGVFSKVAVQTYNVDVNVLPGVSAGTVTGTGTYEANTTATLTAEPNTGYKFVEWQSADGTTLGTDVTYTFTVTSDVVLSAVFEAVIIPKYTVTLYALPDVAAGIVTGQGTYEEGTPVTITATANEGYTFVKWQDEQGELVSLDATYTFGITENVTYSALFEETTVPMYAVRLNVLPNADAGTVTGEGRFKEGETVTVTATANEGYRFVKWQDEDGKTVSVNAIYTFELTADVTYTAVFEKVETANEQLLKAAFNVGASKGNLYIENINAVMVRDVTVFNTVGRKVANFTPNSTMDLTLPVDVRVSVLVVRIVSEQGAAVYKVYMH